MQNTIQTLIAAGDLRQALEQLTHPSAAALRGEYTMKEIEDGIKKATAAAALLGEYNRGHQAYLLNTIAYDEWSRIQSRLTQSALALLETTPAPAPPTAARNPPNDSGATRTRKVFLSYSHQDEAMKDQLNVFLAPLRRSGKISAAWTDREILPGQEWDAAIKQELAEADLILLLVSPHFLASDYIWQHEISKAMERHERREAVVIPIILRPCDWQEMPFAKVQGLPRNAKPVSTYTNQDEAWLEVAQGIKRVVG